MLLCAVLRTIILWRTVWYADGTDAERLHPVWTAVLCCTVLQCAAVNAKNSKLYFAEGPSNKLTAAGSFVGRRPAGGRLGRPRTAVVVRM